MLFINLFRTSRTGHWTGIYPAADQDDSEKLLKEGKAASVYEELTLLDAGDYSRGRHTLTTPLLLLQK